MTKVRIEEISTAFAKSLLREIQMPLTPEELSRHLKQPLHKIRDSLQEMLDLGLVASYKGKYIITEKGKATL